MPLTLNRLLPPGPPATALEIVRELGLADPPAPPYAGAGAARPRLLLNMVSTVDGRATVGGRSGPIGNQADRELFHALRGSVDCVMAGAGTVRVERYRRLITDQAVREQRLQRGLSAEPLACIVSGRLALTRDIPLLADPQARVVLITASAASLIDPPSAEVQYIRAAEQGALDLGVALAELHERFAVRTVLCEGGPHLNSQLLAAGLVDELLLCLAPKLAGGDTLGEVLRIVTGADFDPPLQLKLLAVLESESNLFLRYGVRPPG